MGGAFPFAKIYCKGERLTRSAVCTSFASSLAAALPAEWRVSARLGWAGENRDLFEHPAKCVPIVQEVQTI